MKVVSVVLLSLLVDAARIRRGAMDHHLTKLKGNVIGSDLCQLSEQMPFGDNETMQMFLVGIDADCCKEAQAVDNQARMNETAEEPACVTEASNVVQLTVMNGFDCESEGAIKCGNETHQVISKVDESCCPFIEAALIAGNNDTEPSATCAPTLVSLVEDGFCAGETVEPKLTSSTLHESTGSDSSEPCLLSEPTPTADGFKRQIFLAGIDMDCCKEVQAVNKQAWNDSTLMHAACVNNASNTVILDVMKGFDCESKEAIKCGNETVQVISKLDESCCPLLEALLMKGDVDAKPSAACTPTLASLKEDGFCVSHAIDPKLASSSMQMQVSSSMQLFTQQAVKSAAQDLHFTAPKDEDEVQTCETAVEDDDNVTAHTHTGNAETTEGGLGTCCTCSSTAECSNGMFCCPGMKRCVPDSTTGCYTHKDCSPR